MKRELTRLAVALGAVGLVLSAAPGAALGTPKPVPSEIVDSTRGHGRVVSFTFDDGPNPTDTLRLLSVLRRHHVKAVFCLWGDHVDQHPGVVRRIAGDGHTLCNHSMHHDDMGPWTAEQVRADLLETNAAIQRAVPGAKIPYFRAPFGSWGVSPMVAASLGMRPLGWRLAIADWETPGSDVLLQRLRDGITPGAVVLMHDGGGDRSQTVDAVETIIPELRASRWHFGLPAR